MLRTGLVLAGLTASVLLLGTGCALKSSAESTGKFTEEEMETIMYPAKTALPAASGGFTITVGSDVLTVDEVIGQRKAEFGEIAKQAGNYEQFEAQAADLMQAVVANKIADLLLYQKARSQMPDHIDDDFMEKIVDDEITRFVASHGGNYSDAEKAIKAMGLDWKDFRDYQKRVIITQSYLASEIKRDRPIKYSEIVEYYEAIRDEQLTSKPFIQFRLIDIDFAEIEVPDVNDPPSIEELAKAKADEITDKMEASEESFAILAKEYSDGFAADDGGLWEPVSPGSLASPYDVLEEKAKKMRVGDVSALFQLEGHIFIMQLVKRSEGSVIPLEAVQSRIEQELEFKQRKTAIDGLMMKMLRQVDVNDVREFVGFCLKKAYDNSF